MSEDNKLKISDTTLEKLLTVLSSYVIRELESVISFEKLSDDERTEVLKVALKSCEVTTQILSSFYNPMSLKTEILDKAYSAIKNNRTDEADEIIATI